MNESFPTPQPPGGLQGPNYGESLMPRPCLMKAVTSLCSLFHHSNPEAASLSLSAPREPSRPGSCSWHTTRHYSFLQEAEQPARRPLASPLPASQVC